MSDRKNSADRARARAIRARMRATGEPYSVSDRALRASTGAATALIDPALLAPYPDENDVTAQELGWRVLPVAATAAQRAFAEAVWWPVRAERPCRCSGKCDQGTTCGVDDDDDGPCSGRIIHVDRYPGSMFSTIVWFDEYQCDTCNQPYERSIELPELAWGERHGQALTVYDGVRHPNFSPAGWVDDGCGECGAQAGYRCTCHDVDDGCPECGAGGDGDPYGECVCAETT